MALSPTLRRRLLRLALKALLALIPLLIFVVWHQRSGLAALAQVQAAHAAEGLGGTLHDLLAGLPAADGGRQARWWAWQVKAHANEDRTERFGILLSSDPDARKWRLGLAPHPPPALVEAHAAVAELIDEAAILLADGPFPAGLAGTLRASAHPDDPTWLNAAAQSQSYSDWRTDPLVPRPSLLAVRLAANGLCFRALDSTAPQQACTGLRTLMQCFTTPLGLEESMLCVLVAAIRDETLFGLAVRGTLPEQERARWLTSGDQPAAHTLVAEGFRGDRLLRLGSMCELAHGWRLDRFTLPGFEQGWKSNVLAASLWWNGPDALATCLEADADIERRLRRGPAHPFSNAAWTERIDQLPLRRVLAINLVETGITAFRREWESRSWRLAALLAMQARDGTALPEDISALRARLGERSDRLDGGVDRLAIAYRRLSPARFVLSVDPERSVDGELTPLARYRKPAPATLGPPRPLRQQTTRSLRALTLASRISGPAPPARDDAPPRMRHWGELEIWLPEPTTPAR